MMLLTATLACTIWLAQELARAHKTTEPRRSAIVRQFALTSAGRPEGNARQASSGRSPIAAPRRRVTERRTTGGRPPLLAARRLLAGGVLGVFVWAIGVAW